MVKHTETNRLRIADELFECVWPFCGVGAYRINSCLLYFHAPIRILETIDIKKKIYKKKINLVIVRVQTKLYCLC